MIIMRHAHVYNLVKVKTRGAESTTKKLPTAEVMKTNAGTVQKQGFLSIELNIYYVRRLYNSGSRL